MIRAALLIVLALLPGPAAAQPPQMAGTFTLTAPDGATVTQDSYRGRWQLIYFGYTFCPDACPTALNEIGEALDALGPSAALVQPLFITIDPRRDTRAVMGDYVKAFHPGIVGLTGEPSATAAAARAYGVIYQRQEDENGGPYLFEHSAFITVIDPDGRLVTKLAGDMTGEALAAAVAALMNDRGGPK